MQKVECFNKTCEETTRFYKDNVHKTKVRYQTPGCRSLTLMHIVVIGNPREFLVRGVVSLKFEFNKEQIKVR